MFSTPWLNPSLKSTRKGSCKTPAIAVLLVAVLSMSACSGGGSATNPVTTPPPSPPPALAITSSAPTAANEGDVYTYAIATTDPASKLAIVSGPSGAQISGNTLTWTPTHLQSRITNAFKIQATNAASAAITQDFSVTPLGTIRGTAVDNYVTSTGNVINQEDLTKVFIGASVLNSNTWSSIEGIAHSDGSFEIPGVPAGSYWFTAASGGYWTSASDIDLGQDFLGRQDRLIPTSPAYLTLSLLALKSWETTDSLDLFNANLGQDFDWSDNINPGDTSVSSQWQWSGPLSDASRGDAWYATQVGTKEVGDATWRYLAKATPGILITQADGSTTEFPGALSDPTPLTVHIKTLGSQFVALAPLMGLNAEVHSTTLGIYSQPFTTSKGLIGDAQTLLERDGQAPITQDIDFGDIIFGNPFPTNWTPVVSLEYEFTVPFTASGATSAADVPAELYQSTTQLPAIDGPLTPVISPVRNVTLNGSSFTQMQSTATLTPTISWDPPATGPATDYRLTVYQLTKTGSTSSYLALVDLFTKNTGMTIPNGILIAGKEYFFAIRSYLVPSVDLIATPYRAGLPWAHTDMLSPVISTSGGTLSANVPALSARQRTVSSGMDQAMPRAGSIRRPGLRNASRPTVPAPIN